MFIIILVLVMLSGCRGQEEVTTPTDDENSAITEANIVDDSDTYELDDDVSEQSNHYYEGEECEITEDGMHAENVVISVYVPDANFIGLEPIDVAIDTLNHGHVLVALIENDVLPPGIMMLSFVVDIEDGNKVIAIDFSDVFNEFLSNQGTTGEHLTLGGVVNTFLSAYEGEKVRITVNGEALVTSHGLEGDFSRFE